MLPASIRRNTSRATPAAPPGEARRITAYAAHTVLRRKFRQAHLFVVRQGQLSLGAVMAGRGEALLVARGTEADLAHGLAGDARHEAVVLTFDAALTRDFAAAPDVPMAQGLVVGAPLAEAVQEAVAFLHARSVAVAQQRQRLLAVLQAMAAQGHAFPAGSDAAKPTGKAHGDAAEEEARLDTALTLLQTTRLPMASVVQQCGGTHPARFAAAFTVRFGFAPSLLRAGPPARTPR